MIRRPYGNILKKLGIIEDSISITRLTKCYRLMLVDKVIPILLRKCPRLKGRQVGTYNGILIRINVLSLPLLAHEITHHNEIRSTFGLALLFYNFSKIYRMNFEIDGYLNQLILSDFTLNKKNTNLNNLTKIIKNYYCKDLDEDIIRSFIRKRFKEKLRDILK